MKKIIYLVFAFFAMSSASNAQTISMIGDGVSGWGTDVNMTTSDNNIYTLSNFTFSVGGAKFRQNASWDNNWGAATFPSGTGTPGGANIPTPAGVYDVTFNLTTKAYQFTAVAQGFDDISVYGSANGNVDIAMSTLDGINYTILDADLSLGTLIFRKDNADTVTWGDSAFPSGTATSGGTAIEVTPGTYNINFNKNTGVYAFSFAPISVIGSAKGGWTTDTYLTTQDGENYTLNMSAFTTGQLKFRKNGAWAVSWGGSTFPNGTGLTSGDIPVQGGNYVVAFNRLTGAYSFSSNYPTISLTSNGVDTDMFSGDGINYSKSNVDIAAGNYQFRQANANDFVWGAAAFPSGTAETYITTSIAIPGGRYNIVFNKETGAYSFTIKRIGILGNATPNGWDNITPMTTTDGVNYKLNAVTLTDGELKFRQGDDWNTSNWGSSSFPVGTGTQGGNNIPVSASKYNISFNVLTGAYVFADLIRTKVSSSQCGSTLSALNTDIMATNAVGVTEYKFKVVANGTTEIIERGHRRFFNLTSLPNGATYNTAYTISVSSKYNNTWSTYGPECVVTTPALPTTKVRTAQCGVTLASKNTDILADNLQFATAYRFKVVVNNTSYEVNPVGKRRYFNLTLLPIPVTGGTTYTISVAAQFNSAWGEIITYGAECTVITPADASNSRQATESTSIATSDFSAVAYPNPSSSAFKLQFNGANDGAVSIVVFDMTGRQMENKVINANDIENISLGQNYSTGIYNVVVSQGMKTKTVRLVKN
jgi:hypothetical protein